MSAEKRKDATLTDTPIFDEDSDIDLEVADSLEDDSLDVTGDDLPSQKASVSGRTKRRAAGKGKGLKASLYRVLAKFDEVTELAPETLSIVAEALSVAPDPSDIAVAIVAEKPNVSPIDDLIALSAEAKNDPFSATAVALGLSREGSKRMWAIIGALSGDTSTVLSPKDSLAASQIARAAASLSDTDIDHLVAADAVLKG